MAIRTTEAVVLRTRAFRNTSLIAVVYTRDFGKVQVLAKGIRERCARKDSKFFCFLEPLTLDKIVYYQKSHSGLHLVTQADLLNQYQPIRRDLGRLAAAGFMLELVDKGTQLEDANKAIFNLLTNSLDRLSDREGNIKQALLFFQEQFLNLSGFMPKNRDYRMPVTDFIRTHIDSEFKSLEFMEKIKNG